MPADPRSRASRARARHVDARHDPSRPGADYWALAAAIREDSRSLVDARHAPSDHRARDGAVCERTPRPARGRTAATAGTDRGVGRDVDRVERRGRLDQPRPGASVGDLGAPLRRHLCHGRATGWAALPAPPEPTASSSWCAATWRDSVRHRARTSRAGPGSRRPRSHLRWNGSERARSATSGRSSWSTSRALRSLIATSLSRSGSSRRGTPRCSFTPAGRRSCPNASVRSSSTRRRLIRSRHS